MLVFSKTLGMEFGAKNLATAHHLCTLNALESFTEMSERGRNRFMPRRDTRDEELVRPKPRHAVVGICSAHVEASAKPIRRQRGTTSLPAEGEARHEILEILFSKSNSGDAGNPESPIAYFSGSPPCRASNPMIHDVHFTQKWVLPPPVVIPHPMIHDVQFTQKWVLPPPVVIPQKSSCSSSLGGNSSVKSSCSSSYGSKPFVRIEGFVSSMPDSHWGVHAYA